MAGAITAEWIAVDWGTSRLRAWAMDGETVLAEAASDDGMARLDKTDFEPALLRLIEEWLGQDKTTVLACGMVGARQGWQEAPYRKVPCAPVCASEMLAVETADPRLEFFILAGLAKNNPADVMRGEEVQIAGFLAGQPAYSGTLLLPGTHSKHVRVADGIVTGFTTHMTGEVFEVLCKHSILKHSISEGAHDPKAFAEGVAQGPEALARLFSIRAEGLVREAFASEAKSKLSGLLIGAELATLAADTPVAVIGSGPLSALYLSALEQIGIPAQANNGGALVRAGLCQIYKEIS